MKDINTCEDLIRVLGKEKVDKLFMEYVMLTIAKANLYDQERGEAVTVGYDDDDE